MGAPNFRKLERTELTVPPTSAGARLDRFLADQFPDYSRSLLAGMIKDGLVAVEGLSPGKVKPALKLEAGWQITVEKPTADAPDLPRPILLEANLVSISVGNRDYVQSGWLENCLASFGMGLRLTLVVTQRPSCHS